MVRIVQNNQFKALKSHETAMVSRVLSMNYIRVVHLDLKRRLTASPAPQLQWQRVVSWRESPPKKTFFRIVSVTKGHSSTSAFT